MAITSKETAMLLGGAFGAYSSDILENPLSGLISTGIGATVGGLMTIPNFSLKETSKVNVGPSVNISTIEKAIAKQEAAYDPNNFQKRLSTFTSRTKSPLESRISSIEGKFKRRDTKSTSELISRQIRAKENIEQAYKKETARINKRYKGHDKNAFVEKDRQEVLEFSRKEYERKLGKVNTWIDNSQTESFDNKKRSQERLQRKIDKVTTKYNREESTYSNIKSILNKNGIHVGDDRQSIIKGANGVTDPKIMENINLVLKNNDVSFIDSSNIKANQWKSKSKTLKADDLKGLTNWLHTQVGNNVLDAQEKAKMFSSRFGDGPVYLKDGTISFIDKVNSERVTVPLTSYTEDGTRYHSKGNGNYHVAHQFNPYSAAYVSGQEVNIDGVKRAVTANDVVKGYDPETMLKFLPDNKPVSDIIPRMNSLFHYDSQEAGTRTNNLNSNMFKNNQGVVNLGNVLKYDQYGELVNDFPLRSLQQTATKDLASERQRTMLKLANDLPPEQAAHLLDGISLGNLNSINTDGFTSLAALAPNERGETTVGNRGTSVVNKNANTLALEDMLGSERFNKQFSSSQVLNRLDIKDPDLFNSIVSSVYGNDHVLGDGAGFFNIGDSDSLRIKDKSIIKIPLTNNMAIANPDLLVGLTSPNGLSDYLNTNPININNSAIAYNKDNAPIGLNRAYSNGTIVDGFITDKDVRLVVESEFNPTEEKNLKLFSTGTKSLNTGLSESRFNITNEIGLATNTGRLVEDNSKNLFLDGNHIKSRAELVSILSTEIEAKKLNNTYIQNTLISRAEDTGSDKIRSMIEKGSKVAEGNTIYDLLVSKGHNQQTSAMTAALLSEHKSAVDLTATLVGDLQQGISEGRLPTAFKEDFLYHFNTDNFMKSEDKVGFLEKAHNLVASSNMVDKYLSGQSLAVGSFNKGQSIVGTGNRAKMSWLAVSNLKASGFTNEDLNHFGAKNENALYELKSLSEERRRSSSAINEVIKGKEASFLNMMNQSNAPEKRLELMKGLYGSSADTLSTNPFLTYNLTDSNHEIKSINFSRITTDRSGLYEKDNLKILKELEKKKLNVMIADLAYRESSTPSDRKLTSTKLTTILNDYDSFSKKMLSGDNNLLKDGLSIYSEKSSVMQVKYIGGNADAFATSELKSNRHAWFLSEEEAHAKASQLGVDLSFEKIDGYDNLKRPVFKRGGDTIPLASLVTREPAQGPLSSDLVSWYVDETISSGNRGNSFVPLSNDIYYKGMFGDGDQDTVQTLLGDFQNKAQYDSLEEKRRPIRQSFFDMAEVNKSMQVKGKSVTMKSIADFETSGEHASYRVSGGLKGRNRKVLAATVTGLSLAYSKALELDLGHLGGTSKELSQGRMMIHQLSENLLKSAHLDTEAFQLVNEQSVEKLTRMRNGFLGKKGYEGVTLKQYEAELRNTLPQALGLNDIDISTPKGLLTKKQGMDTVNNIIGAELRQSVTVGNNPFSPLDINEKRFSKTSGEFISAAMDVIKEQGITEMDYESGLKHLRKSTGQVSLGLSDMLMDTLKSNKGVIAGGLAAMAGVAILGREQPSFSDSRNSARQHGASMLRSPGSYDEPTQNNAPMAIETNPTKAGYILPKAFSAKGIKVGGDFVNGATEIYNDYNSLLDVDTIHNEFYNVSSALFGDNIRSARLQTNN